MAMRERCNNPHNKRYNCYGGRGIKVCEEWDSFEAFRAWAQSSGYEKGLTIDRVDVNAGYHPGNCRWATRSEQNRNYRRNRMLTLNGKTQCVQDWAHELGLNSTTILFRLRSGMSVERALTTTDLRRRHI